MARKPTFIPPTSTGAIIANDGAGGVAILDARSAGHWALLISRGDGVNASGYSSAGSGGYPGAPSHAYGHVGLVPNEDGTWSESGELPTGTPSAIPAYEVNGRDDVPTEADGVGQGAIVWLEPIGDIGFGFRYGDNPSVKTVTFNYPIAWQETPGDPCTIIPSAYETVTLRAPGLSGSSSGSSGPTTSFTLSGDGGTFSVNVGGGVSNPPVVGITIP